MLHSISVAAIFIIFEKKGGFDVRSVIKFQKKKEVENKKRKQNDAINENLQRKIKKRLHAVRVIVQWT